MNNTNTIIQGNFNLGLKNLKKNNFKKSEVFFKKVLNENPKHLQSIFFLGIINAIKKDFLKAKDFFDRVLKIDTNHGDALYNLGLVLFELKEFEKSINYFEKAIKVNPKNSDAYNNLGFVYYKIKEFENSTNYFQKAIETNSNNVDAYNNFGNSLNELGQLNEAVSYYKKAIQINPNYIKAHGNLGITFYKLGKFQEAIKSHEKVLKIYPKHVNSLNLLGVIYGQLREFEKAKIYHEKAIKLNPEDVDANLSLGILLFKMSNFKKGFEQYEWRKKSPINKDIIKKITGTEWQGEDLKNKTILILSEQGWGTIIQFSRYLYLIEKEYSAKIIFKTNKRLKYLFSESRFKVISDEDNIPKYDYYVYLMSLPRIFYNKTKTIAPHINYIPKNNKVINKWKDKLKNIKGLKVGISWQGRKTYPDDHLRSFSLDYFGELFTINQVNFISLQKGFGSEQISNFKYKNKLIDFSDEMDNGDNVFEDTIAIMQNLDLVISCDTCIPHISSTLGIKTWLMSNYSPEWRCSFMTKEFSFYSSLKIYRAEEINKWDSVISLLKKDLVAYLENSKHNIS